MPENEDKRNVSISEAEFLANETRRLHEFAGFIRMSGRSAEDISLACNLDRRTVVRALQGLPLKSDATERITFYLRKCCVVNGA